SKYKPSMTDNSSSLINKQGSELTIQDITWKMIESAQIKIIKEAFRLRYKKDNKLVSEYAEYVKNLHNADNQDEYIKYIAITLFLNDEAYNRRMLRYRKWYQEIEEAVENVFIDDIGATIAHIRGANAGGIMGAVTSFPNVPLGHTGAQIIPARNVAEDWTIAGGCPTNAVPVAPNAKGGIPIILAGIRSGQRLW
ncbi:16122_t:CDS:2, partial [Cetraspora pellucida]